MQLDTHELAWAAGFFDGEGTTFLLKTEGRRYVHTKINQVDRRALDRFRAAVLGLGKVYGPYARNGRILGAHYPVKPQFVFDTARFEDAQAIVALLWKYLGPVKRDQALAALRGYADFAQTHPRVRHTYARKKAA